MYLHDKPGLVNPGEKVFLGLNPWMAFKVQIQRQEDCIAHDMNIEPKICVKHDANLSIQEIICFISSSMIIARGCKPLANSKSHLKMTDESF